MTELLRGQRVPLSAVTGSPQFAVDVSISVPGAEVDLACFAVDGAGALADDRWFVFYNQLGSPDGAIGLTATGSGAGRFDLDLDLLPGWVDRLVLTASIDGDASMGSLASGHLVVAGQGTLTLSPTTFTTEKAVVLAELYRREGGWRINVVAQGFAGGLPALLAHFGGEEEGAPPDPRATIDARIATDAPHLVSLAKVASVSLAKRGLDHHRARVVLCLDISKSMRAQYESGKVQRFAERVLALGTRLDDDGAIDVFLFAKNAYAFGALSLTNWAGFTDELLAAHPLEGGTRYGTVMQLVRRELFGDAPERTTPLRADLPVYAMVLTDGQTGTKPQAIAQLVASSYEPVFWQFLGLGKGGTDGGGSGSQGFGFLQEMDTLPGRFLDNAGFFGLADLDAVDDDALYDQMMGEYPGWVPQARTKGLLP